MAQLVRSIQQKDRIVVRLAVGRVFVEDYLDVSKNRGTPKSSILIGFSIIFTIHFGVPLFLETPNLACVKPVDHYDYDIL